MLSAWKFQGTPGGMTHRLLRLYVFAPFSAVNNTQIATHQAEFEYPDLGESRL